MRTVAGPQAEFGEKIAKIGNVKTQVFADDHNPPHFHAVSAEFEAVVALADLTLFEGGLLHRAVETALAWARQNMEILINEWDRLNG